MPVRITGSAKNVLFIKPCLAIVSVFNQLVCYGVKRQFGFAKIGYNRIKEDDEWNRHDFYICKVLWFYCG